MNWMRGGEEFNSAALVLMIECSEHFFKKDRGYVKYGGEVGGGLSVGIKVDWVMSGRSGSQNMKQIQL